MAMTGKKVRALMLSLPEAALKPHMERDSFRVKERIFATLDPENTQLNVRVVPAEIPELLAAHPRMFVDLKGWGRLGWIGVTLKHADAELLELMLVAAWRRIASKRAQTAYAAAKRKQ